VIVGAAPEAASWRNLASHLHGEGRQNAKDASFIAASPKLKSGKIP
jgi:hypothetical protein